MQRYSKDEIIEDALENGLITSRDDIQKFRFAQYIGLKALIEYYAYLPRNIFISMHRPIRDFESNVLQMLRNYQYNGVSIDIIISNEVNILRDKLFLYEKIVSYHTRYPILTKDRLYSLPIHFTEIVVDDGSYMKLATHISKLLCDKPDLLRTRADIEKFVDENSNIPILKSDVKNRVDRLITYLCDSRVL